MSSGVLDVSIFCKETTTTSISYKSSYIFFFMLGALSSLYDCYWVDIRFRVCLDSHLVVFLISVKCQKAVMCYSLLEFVKLCLHWRPRHNFVTITKLCDCFFFTEASMIELKLQTQCAQWFNSWSITFSAGWLAELIV